MVRSTPYPWSASQPLAKAFSAAASKQKLPIDYDHCLGYINGRVLSEVVRAAGANPTPATLAAALEKLGELDLGGYALQYGAGRHHGAQGALHPLSLAALRRGALQRRNRPSLPMIDSSTKFRPVRSPGP